MQTELIFKRVGNYATNQAYPDEHCSVCRNEKWGDILVLLNDDVKMVLGKATRIKEYICVGCLLAVYKKSFSKSEIRLSPYNPGHGQYFNDCCGIFNSLNENREIICNECGIKLTDFIDNLIDRTKKMCLCSCYQNRGNIGCTCNNKKEKEKCDCDYCLGIKVV